MAVPGRIAGVAFLKNNGVQYALRGGLEIQPLLFTKEGVAGQDGVHGYKEMPVVPHIKAEVTPTGISIKAIEAITNATITAECADGRTYVLRNAWHKGEASYDAAEGKVTFTFEGLDCREIAA